MLLFLWTFAIYCTGLYKSEMPSPLQKARQPKDACDNVQDKEAALRNFTAIQLAEIAQHLQAHPAVLVTDLVQALRSMGGAFGTSS